ncbi:hypothetical protein W02_42260 [Nitrospira sp. KM1]|nr:hypothetical protein W02_42260 [Nitrospira sp. KM1]
MVTVPTVARAESITLTPFKDATIFGESINQGVPNTDGQDLFNRSNGAGPGIFSGGNGALAAHRALIEFDVAGQIPQGALITGVALTMHIGIVAGSGGAPGLGDQTSRIMDLHRLTADWGEGITGATSTTVGGTGQGFPANPGDATWNASHFGSTLWNTPGGDFDSTVSGSLAVGSVFFSPQTWQSTPGMVTDVQNWLNDPSSNFGWILINHDEKARQTHRAFYSKEWTDPAMRPQLLVTYELAPVPVPAVLWLFGSGLVGVIGYATRNGIRLA